MPLRAAPTHQARPGQAATQLEQVGPRLLLISYHFPPSREVGALRWQQLAKFAVERGWALDVVTLETTQVAAPDWAALAGLPPGVQVYGVPDKPRPFDRLLDRIVALRRRWLVRGRSTVPSGTPHPETGRPQSLGVHELKSPLHSPRDALRALYAWRAYVRQRDWSRRAARVGRVLLEGGRYRGVITCGPPHPVHEAGLILRRRTGVPFVVDMRDLWSLTPRIQEPIASPVAFHLARRLERRVVRRAALIVANTDEARRAMEAAYPIARDRVIAILNGYDDDPVPPPEHGRCFVVGYAGSIYLDRDPRPLLRAVAWVTREHGVTPDQLRVEFMGAGDEQSARLQRMAVEEGIPSFLRSHPAGSRADAQRFLAGAAMLVSLPLFSMSGDSDPSIPAKVFEYARFDAWLLALANPGSATAALLEGTGADVVPPNDPAAIAAVIESRYAAFTRGVRPARPQLPERYSRRSQAQLLFDELERRLPTPQAAPA